MFSEGIEMEHWLKMDKSSISSQTVMWEIKLFRAIQVKSWFHLTEWKPFEYDENVFCFTLKALSVLKTFKFLPWLSWSCKKTAWEESLGLIFKFMTSQTGEQIIQHTYYPISQEAKAIRQ